MAMKRITKRWLFNSFGVILVVLIAIVIGFAMGIRSYYYNAVRQIMVSQAAIVSGQLSRIQESDPENAQQVIEGFSYRDRIELMALDASGKIVITSSGFVPTEEISMPDYDQAVRQSGYGEYQGDDKGENVLAITQFLPSSSTDAEGGYAAVRLLVSLTSVDRQIVALIILITLVGMAILFFVILSSSYFINSIVIPVGQVGQTARKIAQGDFDARLEKKNDDEIGELCDIINYMAGELSAADRMKNDFISSVSHELRTPLTAIKGWGETLLTSGASDPETMEKGMHVIINETERLSSMVEELLDFSRMQSGRLTIVKGKLDILAELGEAVLMFTERAKREGVKLLYDEPEDFIPVMGDRNRLRQAFVNVIDNALKYSETGGEVTVSVHNEGDYVRITVADKGCGISTEDLPKVKNKFYKGNSTRRGSGIGLAMVDEIVRLHEGTFHIDSVEGEGTTVTLRFPVILKKSEGDATKISRQEDDASGDPPKSGGN